MRKPKIKTYRLIARYVHGSEFVAIKAASQIEAIALASGQHPDADVAPI